MIRRITLLCAMLGLLASVRAQDLTINGISDRTTYQNTVTFTVPVTAGYTYRVLLDGVAVPAALPNVVNKVDYHEVTVWRTNAFTAEVTNRTVRFIVQASNRGSPEKGLTVWTPYPPIPSTAAEFAGAQLHLVAPATYPLGLDIPMIAWVDDGNEKIVRGNGWVTAAGFESTPFRIVRGHGFGILPAAASAGTLNYNATLPGVTSSRQIEIEAATSWTTVSGILPGNTTWPANSRIAVTSHLTIPAGTTLTIGEGTIVRLNSLVNITNNGTCVINGTLEQPVVMTGTATPAPERNTGAWGGFIMRNGGRLIANGAIMAGAGGATSFSFSPGASHRSEQALLLVHSGSSAMLTNCYLINQAGQIANGYNSDITYDRCLLQRAITSGESVGGTIILNKTAVIEFPTIDGVYNATIADSDYDGIYFTTGTHILIDSLFGFCKDDAIDSGSGGTGTVLVTNCWVESALHEALAWSGGGRQTWTYDTVLMNSGQGIEAGWTEGSTDNSPNVFANRLFTTGNSVGARFGDNYDWSYYGRLRITNSLILHNYRDVFAKTWNTSGSSWDTNRWVDRLAQMDLRSNYLTSADARFPSNIVWNPSVHASRVAPFMTTPEAAAVGIGLAVWTNQFSMATIFEGVPVRLSSFTTHDVSVNYTVSGPGGSLDAGTLTFAPGETLKRIMPTGFDLTGQTPITVAISAPQGGEVTGVSEVTFVGTVPAPSVSIATSATQLGMERLGEGVPLRLNAPSMHSVEVDYSFAVPGNAGFAGTVTIPAGATLAWVSAPPIAPVQYDIVRFDLLGATDASLSGQTNLYFVKSEPPPPSLPPVTLKTRGTQWKYLDDGSNQGTAWRAPTFSDTTWSNGVAQLGFGDNDEITRIRRTTSGGTTIITFYFRSTFVVTNVSEYDNLSLWMLRDDGGVVYVNGTEIFRSPNMPPAPTTITSSTLANFGISSAPADNTTETAIVPATPLVEGTNVVAVEIHQYDTGSSDMSFDFELVGTRISGDASPQRLRFGSFDGNFVLGWNDGSYVLEEANTVTGIWNQVVSPSPITVSPTNSEKYYRLRR